jgi:hypothetical protein
MLIRFLSRNNRSRRERRRQEKNVLYGIAIMFDELWTKSHGMLVHFHTAA